MERRSITPLVISLLIALTIGLVPGMAFADELKADAANLTTQSSSVYLVSPTTSDNCIVGQPVTVVARSNLYLYQYGYPVTNYITFRVTQGGKTIYYGAEGYNSAGATVSITFTPKKAAKCKIDISGIGFSQKAKDFEAVDSVTIKIKKAAAFKKTQATLWAERIAKNKVRLSWDTVGTGAKIYRATTRDGKYKLIKTIKSTKGNSFVDKVSKNKNYFYKLRYYLKSGGKTYLSKFSESQWKFAKAPSKPINVKAKKSGKKIKLTWKTTKDCGHFWIYRSTKKKSGYEAIDAVSGNQFNYIDKNVQSGKKYYYKVEACIYYDWNGVTKSKKSAVVSAKA